MDRDVFRASAKRGLSLALVASLALLFGFVFAVPGPPARRHPERIPVRFWHMWTAEWKDIVDRIVLRFNESQDRYEVVALSIPPSSNVDAKFLLAVVGGDPPDVMAQWKPIIPTWAESRMVRPLGDLMSPAERQRFFDEAYPIAKKIGVYDGRLYGLPIGINVWALYYHPDHMRDAGIDPDKFPESLEQLVELGAKLDKKNARGDLVRLGFLPGIEAAGMGGGFGMYVPVFGGSFYDWSTHELTLDSPAILRCLQYLVDSRKRLGFDVVTRFESAQNAGASVEWPFIGGALSITLDGQWRVEQLAKYAPGLEYRVAPIPPPAGGKRFAGTSDGNFMLIPATAKRPEGAWEFIKFWSGLSDPERAATFHTWGGWLPALSSVAKAKAYQDYLARYPAFRVFVDLMSSDNLAAAAPVPYQVFLADRVTAINQLATRGLVAPKDALRDLVQQVEEERERRRVLRYGNE